jgi:hypothetical protein
MSLVIEHLETQQKNWSKPERRPALIFIRTDDPDITPDLATAFRSECEALLPEIYERASLRSATKASWCPRMAGSWVCLTTDDKASYDVRVIIGPDPA